MLQKVVNLEHLFKLRKPNENVVHHYKVLEVLEYCGKLLENQNFDAA